MLKDAGGAGEPVNSSGVPSYFLQRLFGGWKAPPPMPKLDVGRSGATDYVEAMSALANLEGQLLATRQRYDPQYQEQLGSCSQAADPMADLAEQQGRWAQEFGGQMAERQAEVIYLYLIALDADMTQAARASDLLMQAALEQANQLAEQAVPGCTDSGLIS